MLGDLSHVEKIYIRTGYTDMRKQLNGLVDIIKAVHYEGDGFCLLYKRFENGRLKWPRNGQEARQLSEQQLRWLLEGLSPDQPGAVRDWAPPAHP